MMKRENRKAVSFWHFLSQHKIVIPKIQRDYAQGRKNKTELRKAFLKDIKAALESCNNTSKNEMKMDFVYGVEKNNVIEPLDGQQRLTTLWLLHWYVALQAGKLKESSARELLKKFTYQTRTSSRAFCEQLCDKGSEMQGDNLKKSITSQTWFYSAWLQDPTIQAMLRMLCGTKIKDKENKEQPANDGIAQIFIGNSTYFERIWAVLTGETCPIKFYYLDLLGLKLTDDLYIKMNARGKPLSSFENFKADLSGYLAGKEKEDKDEWQELNNMESGYPIKLDTSWAEIFWRANKDFWKNHQNEHKEKLEFRIDDPYFIFLNRIFLNFVVTEKSQEATAEINQDDEEKAYLFKASEVASFENLAFNYLYGKDVKDDTFIEYTSFDYYCYKSYTISSGETGRCVPKSVFETIQKILDNFNSCSNEQIVQCFPERHNGSNFEFIPVYNNKDGSAKIAPVSQTDRVVFFGICKYFEQGGFEGESFRQWMRVVWNIVDAVEINTIDGMVARMRRIDKIAAGSHDIYNYLNNCTPFTKQLEEERIKAKAIIEGTIKEEDLIAVENFSFFNGSIRFLYQDSKGKPNWSNFEQKKNFAKNHLTNELTKSKDASLMKKLFSYMTAKDFQCTLLWHYRVFNNDKESWKYFLLNANLHEVLDKFLLEEQTKQPQQVPTDENTPQYWLYHLSYGELLDFVMDRIPKSWIRDYHNHKAIYPSAPGIFLNAKKRDNFFSSYSREVKVKNDHVVKNTNFLYGNDINFEFQGKNFQWNYENKIWSIDNNGNRLQELICTKDMENDAIIEELRKANKLNRQLHTI